MKKREFFRIQRAVFLILGVICLILAIFFLRTLVTEDVGTPYKRPGNYVESVQHRVLLFCSYTPIYYTFEEQIAGFDEGLCENGIEYDVIFMDGKNYASDEDHEAFFNFLVQRLKKHDKYDGIIVVDDDALRFVCEYRELLFGDLPIVFIGANDLTLARKASAIDGVTGFYENDYLNDTMELALRLFPEKKKYVGLYDNSVAGKSDGGRFNRLYEKYPDLEFHAIDVSTRTMDELAEDLRKVDKDSVVIYMTCFIDVEGVNHSIFEMTKIISDNADAPIFRCYESGVGEGVLASVGMCFYVQAKNASEVMKNTLNGANINEIPLNTKTPSVTEFDYKLMQKYGIKVEDTPKDSVIYNKPLNFFDLYGNILPSAGLIILSLFCLLMAANATIWDTKIANQMLTESRDHLQMSQERLRFQAEHDDFLKILNRRTAVDHMREKVKPDSVYSVIMVDIDNFKDVNETYGHKVADEVLKHISSGLETLARPRDYLLARYGGDEFLIMVPGERVSEECETIEEITRVFTTPLVMGEEKLIMSCSIGVSVSDGLTLPEQHIINAEIAMFEAKQRGRSKAFLYSEDMKRKVHDENKIKAKVLDAIENQGFHMVYQPQVDAITREVTGYEALIRMNKEGLYPGVFIPIAESSGWIVKIGRITTELVIRQMAKWRDAGNILHPVSINFSSNQINDLSYASFLKDLLRKYGIPGHLVKIEVTESLFLERTERADHLFNQLKEMDIEILMDDFGTGYSSLGYLTYIPIDIVKLDKSLVDAYLVGGKDAFIRDVIQLVHDLDKKIIIEGVEEKWQYERLREFGADIIQGFYFSKPKLPEDAIKFRAVEE